MRYTITRSSLSIITFILCAQFEICNNKSITRTSSFEHNKARGYETFEIN